LARSSAEKRPPGTTFNASLKIRILDKHQKRIEKDAFIAILPK
jgi:hypothetical protein